MTPRTEHGLPKDRMGEGEKIVSVHLTQLFQLTLQPAPLRSLTPVRTAGENTQPVTSSPHHMDLCFNPATKTINPLLHELFFFLIMFHKNQITIVLGVEKVLQTEIVKCFVKKNIFYVKIGMTFIKDKTY